MATVPVIDVIDGIWIEVLPAGSGSYCTIEKGGPIVIRYAAIQPDTTEWEGSSATVGDQIQPLATNPCWARNVGGATLTKIIRHEA